MKFKVGDKVKRTGGNGCLPIGTITKIIEVRTCGDVKVSYDNEWYDEKYFELVEEKVIQYGFNLATVGTSMLPKQIFFNDKKKTTVLKWENGDITKVKCNDDEFDEKMGFLIAYFQYTCGLSKNKANKYLESLVPEDKPIEENDTPIEILDTEE